MPIGKKLTTTDPLIVTRIGILEDTTHEYEIYESIASGASGAVTIPTHGSIVLDQYPGAADCLVCKVDAATGKPIDEIAKTTAGVAITGTLNVSGAYTISGTPSSYPVALVFQIQLAEKYKTDELLDSRILNEQSADKVNMDQTNPQLLTGFGRGTRIIEGGHVTQNSSTSIDIAAGRGVIYDSTTQKETPVSWNAFTNYSIADNISAGYDASHIFINSSGGVYVSTTEPINGDLRNYIYINKVAHRSGGAITATRDVHEFEEESVINLAELAKAIGTLNLSGNVVSYYSTALQIQKSSGTSFRFAANSAVNRKNPSYTTDPSIAPITFTYCQQKTGGGVLFTASQTSIIPGKYDAGNSTLGNVGISKYTIQRVFSFPVTNSVYIFYGRVLYSSMDAAVASISTEPFTTGTDFFSGASLLGYISVKWNATNLSLTTNAIFTPAGKFSGAGGGGSAGVTTMQASYDNSVQPQIITSTTNGAIQNRCGSAADTDSVYEVLNKAGTKTASIAGDGTTYISGYTKLGGSTAPAVKIKKLTGTTAAAEGGTTDVAHGITDSQKIISIVAMVNYITGQGITNGYQSSGGYQFDFLYDGTNVTIRLHPTNSENILSKSFIITIIYEE